MSIAWILAGLVFPPLLALPGRSKPRFALLLALELALVGVFFFVFWGPAVLGHLALWAEGVRGFLFRPAPR